MARELQVEMIRESPGGRGSSKGMGKSSMGGRKAVFRGREFLLSRLSYCCLLAGSNLFCFILFD